jgi:hypothetical protein
MKGMRIAVLDTTAPDLSRVVYEESEAAFPSVTVEFAGLRVHVSIGDRDAARIQVDPSGSEGNYRLDVRDLYANTIQVALTIKSVPER